jgi:hypothetical protein
MVTASHILIALFVLAIVAVLAGSKQTPAFITAAGGFLVNSVKKVQTA